MQITTQPYNRKQDLLILQNKYNRLQLRLHKCQQRMKLCRRETTLFQWLVIALFLLNLYQAMPLLE